jgi:hypothetical protein
VRDRADEWWAKNSTPREKALLRLIQGYELTTEETRVLDEETFVTAEPKEMSAVDRAVADLRLELGVAVPVELMTPREISHHVTTDPETVHARAVLVEVYRLLTDFVTPNCALRPIEPAIGMLEAWIDGSEAHCASA